MNSSQNGVVYVSLGSKLRFSDLPPQTVKVFLNVFSSIHYDVLIKWNGGELPNKPENVRLERWLPQNDLLRKLLENYRASAEVLLHSLFSYLYKIICFVILFSDHPKIKAFITQGGLQSTDEAIAAKVPLLALPVFGDQFYNAHKYVQHGIGEMLDINTIEENQLRNCILKLIEDKRLVKIVDSLNSMLIVLLKVSWKLIMVYSNVKHHPM